MKKRGSEKNLYIESEDEDDDNDEEKVNDEREGDDSDSMDSDSVGSARRSRQSSYATQWPQSYRQSIDMYSNVASPNIGFLGTPIKRLNSSYLVSSLQRLHTPEILVPFIKPLLTTESTQQQEPYPLIPPDQKKDAKTFHELPVARQCSYSQAVLNGINVLCGVGLLSMPYAIKEGGWTGLGVLFLFGIFSFYTGLLLRHCLDSEPGLETYPDIGQAAFGTYGRIAISIILYVELYACCVEYIILESDNLSALFPNAQLNFGGLVIGSHYLFAFMTALAVLPTVWLRDLSVLSYISVGGVVASILVSICLLWMGVFDNTGFQHKGTILNLTNLPVALGLYGYCYSGHAVFPNIYSSMKNPNQYPAVLLTSFLFCTILYAGVAATGYTMYGDSIKSQFTLNLPDVYVASKIAIWTTVVNPFTKYPIMLHYYHSGFHLVLGFLSDL